MRGSSSERPTAAQRGLQARHQLARAKRLGDVVVGSCLERPYLLLLLADSREHENRHLTPLAQQARELDAVHIGQHQIDDRRLRRAHGRSVQRLAAVSAGTTSKPASRSTTRRARRICGSSSTTRIRCAGGVVGAAPISKRDDGDRRRQEGLHDTRAGSTEGSPLVADSPASSGAWRQRQLEHERGALPWQRLDMQPAAVGLGEATRDRKPQARAAMSSLRRAGAVEGFKHALQLRRRDAGAAIDDCATHQRAAGVARPHPPCGRLAQDCAPRAP